MNRSPLVYVFLLFARLGLKSSVRLLEKFRPSVFPAMIRVRLDFSARDRDRKREKERERNLTQKPREA